MAGKTVGRKYPCANCGRRARPEELIYSRFTKNHYCADLDACSKRRKRRGHRKEAS